MAKVFEIPELKDLKLWLKTVPELATKELSIAMTRSVRIVESVVKPYPPSTDSNRPGRTDKNGRPMGYYERGRGYWYPVMQAKTLGETLGKAQGAIKAPKGSGRVVGYKLAKGGTSQNLGRKWTVEVRQNEGAIEGVIGNTADYAEYVQGGKQTSLHNLHGWQTLEDAIAKSEDAIMDEFGKAADRIAESFSRE